MKLIVASVICLSAYGSCLYFRPPLITQRLVHVIEIGPDHPPKYYDLLEDVTR